MQYIHVCILSIASDIGDFDQCKSELLRSETEQIECVPEMTVTSNWLDSATNGMHRYAERHQPNDRSNSNLDLNHRNRTIGITCSRYWRLIENDNQIHKL